jgi:predicted nucleic acid-binding protein
MRTPARTGSIWRRNIDEMNRILFDTNVVLDVLLDRQPHVEASAAAWAAVEAGSAEGMLAAHAVTTIHYLVRKEMGNAKASRVVSAILKIFGVAAVDGAVIQEALQLSFSDFEDAVTAAAARSAGCNCIVTRDPKGFRGSPVRSFTPEAVMPLIGKE